MRRTASCLHLGRERDALFTFLVIPEVQATNWRAEHAIRPAVVSRKPWGGNATWTGATGQMAAHRQRHAHHGVARLAVRRIDGEVRWRAE